MTLHSTEYSTQRQGAGAWCLHQSFEEFMRSQNGWKLHLPRRKHECKLGYASVIDTSPLDQPATSPATPFLVIHTSPSPAPVVIERIGGAITVRDVLNKLYEHLRTSARRGVRTSIGTHCQRSKESSSGQSPGPSVPGGTSYPVRQGPNSLSYLSMFDHTSTCIISDAAADHLMGFMASTFWASQHPDTSCSIKTEDRARGGGRDIC